MYEYLDRRYALALYEVAEQKGKVDEYLGDLREICKLIEDNKDFFEVIKHPQIGTKQKKKTFINIFKGKIDEELLSFLLILIEKDRILFLKEKLKEMEKIHLEKLNVLQGIVKTTVPLEENEYNALVEKLEKKYKSYIKKRNRSRNSRRNLCKNRKWRYRWDCKNKIRWFRKANACYRIEVIAWI